MGIGPHSSYDFFSRMQISVASSSGSGRARLPSTLVAFLKSNFWATVCTLSDTDRCPGCHVYVTLVYCGQTVGWTRMPLGMEVGLGPGHSVLDGYPAPSPKGHSPQFSTRVCSGQTAGWTRMPLGMEVGSEFTPVNSI